MAAADIRNIAILVENVPDLSRDTPNTNLTIALKGDADTRPGRVSLRLILTIVLLPMFNSPRVLTPGLTEITFVWFIVSLLFIIVFIIVAPQGGIVMRCGGSLRGIKPK